MPSSVLTKREFQGGAPELVFSREEEFTEILFDANAGNVLIAAGQAMDSVQRNRALLVTELDRAIVNVTEAKEFSSSRPERLFTAAPLPADLPSAVAEFRHQVNQVLEELSSGTRDLTSRIIHILAEQDAAMIPAGLQQLGNLPQVAGMVHLVQQGFEKLKAAFQRLTRMLGVDVLAKLKPELPRFWDSATDVVDRVTNWILSIESVEARLEQGLRNPGISLSVLNEGSSSLQSIADGFTSNVRLLGQLLKAAAFGAALLKVATTPGPALLFALGSYLGVAAVTVVIAREYAGTGHMVNWVRGVGDVADSLVRPAA